MNNSANIAKLIKERMKSCGISNKQLSENIDNVNVNTIAQLAKGREISYESELSAIMMSEAKIRARLNKVYEAFETGVYDIPTFQQRNNSLQQELNEIEKKKEELQKSIRQMTENRKILSEFIPKTRQIVELYDSVSDDQSKNNMLKEIIRRIDYIKLTRGHGHEEDFELTVYPKLPEV